VADDETQTEDQQEKKEPEKEEKPVTQKDLADLTSKFQGQLSAANKTVDELSQSRASLEVQLQDAREQLEQVKGAVTINEDPPPEEVKKTVEALQDQVKTFRQSAIGAFNGWVDAAAERDALKLALEYDAADQLPALTRKFAEAARKDGEKGLRLAFKEAEVDLKTAKAAGDEKKPKPKETKYDDNVQSGRQSPRVIDEMKDIDVTTPEGQKAWEKERRGYARRSGVTLP
jgi:hypothetical protein